jgi:hypothetical protein
MKEMIVAALARLEDIYKRVKGEEVRGRTIFILII